MPEHAIEAQDLVRVFKKGPRAVDGIDLAVAPGEIYGFLGPNGAGKSTTVLMLTTLLPPTAGTAWVGGFDVVREGPQVRSIIGAALQEAALDPLLTGREHLRLGLLRRGVTLSEAALIGALSERLVSAAVPIRLSLSTVHAALRFAARETAAAVVPVVSRSTNARFGANRRIEAALRG